MIQKNGKEVCVKWAEDCIHLGACRRLQNIYKARGVKGNLSRGCFLSACNAYENSYAAYRERAILTYVEEDDGATLYQGVMCNNCGEKFDFTMRDANFCPSCGARFEGEWDMVNAVRRPNFYDSEEYIAWRKKNDTDRK